METVFFNVMTIKTFIRNWKKSWRDEFCSCHSNLRKASISYIVCVPLVSVWAGSHGGDDSLYELLPQSLWIPQGKTHSGGKVNERIISRCRNFDFAFITWIFNHLREMWKPVLWFVVFQDKLGAYFLSKMDSTNKKTQEVCLLPYMISDYLWVDQSYTQFSSSHSFRWPVSVMAASPV